KLENANVELEFQVFNYARENAHLKTTYKNLFDSISVSRVQTETKIASLQNELQSNIYKNAKLRTQLFKKASDHKDNKQNTSVNTKFAKQPIGRIFLKLGKTNALSKPVTSNSVSSPQEPIDVNNDKAKISVKEIQNKYQPKVTKPKNVRTRESLATPKPRKSRFILRWSPTGKLFNTGGKIVDYSESKSTSDCYNGYPDLFVVRRLRLFQAHDRKFKASHQFRLEAYGNCPLSFHKEARGKGLSPKELERLAKSL
nr:hypothetical protein [Tanacetum cinerariifolium]